MASIVAAAWKLAQDNGVAALSLHALAREVGMRQPSLYEYFDSKHALYDTMFADGNRQLLERLDSVTLPRDSRVALKKFLRTFVEFSMEDRARSELLFQRHVPGFTPSPESYALAEEALGRAVKAIREAGVTQQGDIDCIVAMVAGIVEAQVANEPEGTRWTRHLNRLVDLYVDDALARRSHRGTPPASADRSSSHGSGGVGALRRRGRIPHAGGVDDGDRLHRMERPPDGPPRPRFGLRAGLGPPIREAAA